MGKSYSKEAFDATKLSRPPLCCGQGVQALAWAERLDGYRAAVEASSLNSTAREGQRYQPAGLYPRGTTDVSGDEVIPLEPADSPWPNGQVIFMDRSADGGLPHTRPPYYICLPAGIDYTTDAGRQTLTHERIHVSQRLHPKEWAAAYVAAWEWKVVSPPPLPAAYEQRVRINPDTYSVDTYAWKGEWIPVAVFESAYAPRLNKARTVWWHIPSKNIYTSSPPGFDAYYGIDGKSAQAEHPHEIAAYILSSGTNQSPARRIFSGVLGSLPRGEIY
jgi:hypothetical protein